MPSEKQKPAVAKEDRPNARRFGNGFALQVGSVTGNAGLGALALGRTHGDSLDEAVLDKMRHAAKVPVVEPDLTGPDAYFSQGSKKIPSLAGPEGPHVAVAPHIKNPSFLAHELGHADIDRNRLGGVIQNRLTTGLGMTSPLLGTAAGVAAGMMTDDEKIRRAAILSPLALSAPQLLYEAGASLAGIRHMRNAGANRSQMLNYAKTMAPAWGTYATNALSGVGGAMQGVGVGGALRDRKKAKAKEVEGEKAAMLAGFHSELSKIASPDFVKALLKVSASMLPPTGTPGGMMHAEGLLSGLGKHVGLGKNLEVARFMDQRGLGAAERFMKAPGVARAAETAASAARTVAPGRLRAAAV